MTSTWKVRAVGLAITGIVAGACGSVSPGAPAGGSQPGGSGPEPGFTISPTSGPPETVVAVEGYGCQGFDSAIVQVTDDGSETEGASVAPIAADGSWSTTIRMPPALVPGVDPGSASWADPDHTYAVTAHCVASGPDGPSPVPAREVRRLPSQPFDLLPPPPAQPAPFAGFWPVASEAEAVSCQRSFDAGHQPWRGDPEAVARAFAGSFVGWTIEVDGSEVSGSPLTGWNATVRFRAYIGEGPLKPITRHTLRLVGLRGSEHPAWFVAGLSSDKIQVRTPVSGAIVSPPLSVAGLSESYEGAVGVEVTDDSGRSLFAGGFQGGAYDVAPFEVSLAFSQPTTQGGLLVLRGATGVGPVPDMTIVRIGFDQVGEG